MLLDIYNKPSEVFVSGTGMKLYDQEGNEYLDLVSGIAVNALGHCHPAISKTIEEQSKKLLHVSNLYNTKEQYELAERLVELSDHTKTFFCNSGTEAVECALKIARKYGRSKNKNKILYMKDSFHGRTMGSLSVTGQKKYQEEFQPLIGGTEQCNFNNIEDIYKKIEGACSVILEPIQGESGLIKASAQYLRKLREACDENDVLLIFDEVQCGVGRTGSFFAYRKFGVIPDVICMAKGLGGGIPIGAVLVNERSDVLVPGDHGTTFGGNSFACSVGKTVVEELVDKGVLKSIDEKSEKLTKGLEELKDKYDLIEEVKGIGLLQGVKIKGELSKFIKHAYESKILLVGAGNNVVRVIPPLNLSFEDVEIIVDKLDELFEKYGEVK